MTQLKPGVRLLVTSQAIFSSVTQHIQRELINENIIIDQIHTNSVITKYDFRCILIYSVLFSIAAYGEYKFTNYVEPKLKDFDSYSVVKTATNVVVFVICIILTRGVQSAS